MDSVHPFGGVLVLASAVSAVGAGSPQPFTSEAIPRGINFPIQAGLPELGSGLGLFDIDGDGDPDALVMGASDGRVGLYENDGNGQFTDRTNLDGGGRRITPHIDYAGVSAADYDSDGDLDIYLSRYGAPNVLWRNDGNWAFTDVSEASGLDDPGYSLSTCWADCNADGLVDVYVCNRTGTFNSTEENAFYENNGDGTFSEKAVLVGIQRPGDPTLVASFFDYDADGDADLYLGTDKGSGFLYHNHLFNNLGNAFVDVTAQTATEAWVDCMGIAVGDIDRNGWLDIYVTNVPYGHVLLTADGDGTFTDSSAAAGMEAFQIGWGTFFFDFDNDTWEDVYVAQMAADNKLYHNGGSFPLTDIAPAVNVATPGTSYCAATGDIDNDGDLDMLVAQQGEPARLYVNNEGSNRNWAKFNVVGQGLNTFGIGAQVRVRTVGTTPAQIREVRAGHHYKAQDPATLHFGLGDAIDMDKVYADWPNTGAQRLLRNYPANTTWTLYPPERIGDIDLDGDVDTDDRWAVLDRYHLNTSEPIVPGIEVIDADGDADFDLDDVLLIGLPCAADLAPPYGVLDLADVNAFIAAFTAQDLLADLSGDGLLDLIDVGLFITGFMAVCP